MGRDGSVPSSLAATPPLSESALNEILASRRDGGEQEFSGFSVIEKIGQGGFGEVYLARDDRLDRKVALKVLLPCSLLESRARERFLNEARALARVRHPNVLVIHSVIDDDGTIALVTEFIDGKPLSDVLEEQGPFGADEAVRVGLDVCRALAAVHSAGLVHRDVKTSNILREKGGRIVLSDFGLGAFLGDGSGAFDGTESSGRERAGSPLFMAPEQVAGGTPDPRSDLYALGVVLYNLSTDTFPVVSTDLPELFLRIESGRLIPLRDVRPDLPGEFVGVVTRALSRKAEDRFGSAGEMEAALLSCVGGRGDHAGGAPAPPATSGPPKRQGRRAFVFGLGGVAALVLALLLGNLFIIDESFRVEEATLWLRGAAGDRPLSWRGDRVRRGDELYLDFRADSDVRVYVIGEDDAGAGFVLFPHPEGELENPLAGGERHRLPGVIGDGAKNWQVSSAGGREWIYIFASRRPLEALEDAIAGAPSPPPGEPPRYAPLSGKRAELVLRGIGVLADAGDGPPAGPLADYLVGAATTPPTPEGSRSSDDGLWVGVVVLENPR